MIKSSAAALSILLSVASSAAFSAAVTITGASQAGNCDAIDVGVTVPAHELGIAFPGNELISVSAITTAAVACPQNLPAGAINVEVSITNLTHQASFSNLYYIAETGTVFSNYDGLVNGMLAFKIDRAGLNVPLVSESQLADLVFSPGETTPGSRSLLFLRMLGPSDGWFVIGAANPNVTMSTPEANARVAAELLTVEGVGRGFESTVVVTAFLAGHSDIVFDQVITAGGAWETPLPYTVTIDLTGASPGDVVMLLVHGDTGLDNDPGEFSALPVVIDG